MWSCSPEHKFFVSADPGAINRVTRDAEQPLVKDILIPIDNLRYSDVPWLIRMAQSGSNLLIDSGVHGITAAMMRKYGLSVAQVLSLPPGEVEGFDRLYKSYLKIIGEVKDVVWGYVEIDQGGPIHKTKLRTELEAMGFSPIPVYHPFVDGWDYFDELASKYPRICLGNVAFLESYARVRIVYTVYERNKKYGCAIHALGFTPDEILYTFPIASCDSSTWMSGVRWGAIAANGGATPFGDLPVDFVYNRQRDGSHRKALQLSAYDARISEFNWNQYVAEMEQFNQC